MGVSAKPYPDDFLAEYYDPDTGEQRDGGGDSLARFIVAELSETFNPEAPHTAQLSEACNALRRAADTFEWMIETLR